jgi:SPP1 family predicted phage head-tail adaptor
LTLDKLVTFYRKQQTRQASGELLTTKKKIGRAFARVMPVRGSERNASDQTEATANYIFWVAYRTDLIEDDVIEWQGVEYNIRFIEDSGQGSIYLALTAERGVAV